MLAQAFLTKGVLMTKEIDARSEGRMYGVHPDLIAVVRAAHAAMADQAPGLSFVVTEGLRSVTRQAQLVAAGASRTMSSYHITGLAVDLAATVNGDVRWDWPLYPRIARHMQAAANDLGHRITWGGDWDGDGSSADENFKDGPHFQLERGREE